MDVDGTTTAASVAARICNSDYLPSVPPVLATIMARCTEDDVDFGELGALVSSDAALTVRIMGMANSCLLGGVTRITSIRSALTRLGLRLTHATVLGYALSAGAQPDQEFDSHRFWRHALTTSNAARILARHTRRHDPEEAFTAGVLQDVGMLALSCAMPEQYSLVLAETEDEAGDLHEIEQCILGTTHMEVGSGLLAKWHLPQEVHAPILHHHCTGEEVLDGLPEQVRQTAELLRIADTVAQVFNGADCNIKHANALRALKREYGLENAVGQEILRQVGATVERAAGAFDLDPEQLHSYEEIRANGLRKMVQLAAEMEAGFREYQVQADKTRNALSELEAAHEKAKKRAAYDDLTDAMTRGEFMNHLRDRIAATAAEKLPMALIFLDVDRFKWVNDRLGHLAGDTVLKEFAKYLLRSVRRDDVVCRYGGDEFVILLPGIPLEAALDVGERIRQRVANVSPDWLDDFEGITSSIGLLHLEQVSAEVAPETLLHEADQCLYLAKADGRNCVRYRSI